MNHEKIINDILEQAGKIDISVINLTLDLDLDTKKGIKNFILNFILKIKLKMEAKKLAKNSSVKIDDIGLLDIGKGILNKKKIGIEEKIKAYRESLTEAQKNISKYKQSLENFKKDLKLHTSTDISGISKLDKTKKLFQIKIHTKYVKKNSLIRFKKENNIDREAKYPKSKVFFWGTLFIVLILESIANAYFYAQGSELGLLGGILQAFLVSIANILISFSIGFILFRYTNHISNLKKIFSWIGIILSFFILSFLHLITAHYREILIKDPDNSLKNVIYETWNSPFNLSDFDSIILIIVGYAISILVVFKSYKYDDCYPHYGQIDREYHSADIQVSHFETDNKKKFENAKSTLINKYKAIQKINFETERGIIADNQTEIENKRESCELLINNTEDKLFHDLTVFCNEYNKWVSKNNNSKIIFEREKLKEYISKEITSSSKKYLKKAEKSKEEIIDKNKEAEKLYSDIAEIIDDKIKAFKRNIENEEKDLNSLYTVEAYKGYRKNAITNMKTHQTTCYLQLGNEI